jgi:hypothetical protein
MMRKHVGRKPASRRKGAHGRAKARGRKYAPHEDTEEMGRYDPNRGEATS